MSLAISSRRWPGARPHPHTGPLRLAAAAASVLAGLAGCGGHATDGSADTVAATPAAAVASAKAKVSLEPAGAHCIWGGTRIESGIDANGNGALDTAEVTGVQYACNGTPGAAGGAGAQGANGAAGAAGVNSLVRIDAEPAGANCPLGGARVRAGLDANTSAVLDDGEVTSTRYACTGTDGANGSHGTNGSNGSNGTNGSNGANGTDGLDALIAIANEPVGVTCAHGGKIVTSGLDTNRNSVLDGGEVASTTTLCQPSPGAALAWVQVAGTSQAMAPDTGYVATSTSLTTLTLPASPALGDIVVVNGVGSGGWKVAQNAGQFISAIAAPTDRPAGALWLTAGPALDWKAIASSASGERLVAAADGSALYVSTDAGGTWFPRASARNWAGVASSADGLKMVAVVNGGRVYTSTDGGTNWSERTGSDVPWRAVASSAEGMKLVAVAYGGQIHTSTDGGANWTARDSNRNWTSVASSADGRRLVAAGLAEQIYISTDSGVTWNPQGSAANWTALSSSASGFELAAAAYNGQLHISTDGGQNWTARAGVRQWAGLASSADASQLVAMPEGDLMYTSHDGGTTWQPRESSRNWRAAAASADGKRLAAVSQSGAIYRSAAGRTTTGTGGALSGSQYDMLKLQYIGGGEFMPIDYTATGVFHVE
ncbi:MAG: hypothetical protein JNL30_10530 [Rubrivivax sp.]|nr:hypothetical protein [Rubrivivax sp.]